ncbi:YvrJ family protein [Rossellomorea marisflavi]|uniref:YvrJ family protein n=1 Tax=Rossellomorea marisflavi TaxID=189381 RepID=UPI0034578127
MPPVDVSEWVIILGNFGFPIAITIYLFIRFEKKIDKLELVITELGKIIKDSKEG